MSPTWSSAVRCLLFDCDGVLVDSDASVLRAWSRWAREYGLDPDAVHPQVHGRRVVDSVASMLPEALRAEGIERINRYELEDAATVAAVPGARELTAALPPRSWAVVTSGTRALASARLAAARIRPPAVLVTADDIKLGKPAPEGYLAAAAALACPPAACVVLEDATSGELAARAAGVKVVVGVGSRALDTAADIVVEDLISLSFDPATQCLTASGPRLR